MIAIWSIATLRGNEDPGHAGQRGRRDRSPGVQLRVAVQLRSMTHHHPSPLPTTSAAAVPQKPFRPGRIITLLSHDGAGAELTHFGGWMEVFEDLGRTFVRCALPLSQALSFAPVVGLYNHPPVATAAATPPTSAPCSQSRHTPPTANTSRSRSATHTHTAAEPTYSVALVPTN
jgi:hypothetical protein